MGAGALALVLVRDLTSAMGDRSSFTGDVGVPISMLGGPALTSLATTESEPSSPEEQDCVSSPYSSRGIALVSSELPELIEGDICREQTGRLQSQGTTERKRSERAEASQGGSN